MSIETNKITAERWLEVRDRVADEVGKAMSPQTQRPTKINVSEQLLRSGFVDVEIVLEAIDTTKAERAARLAASESKE